MVINVIPLYFLENILDRKLLLVYEASGSSRWEHEKLLDLYNLMSVAKLEEPYIASPCIDITPSIKPLGKIF